MRFALTGCLLILPVAAMANGAMGLGMEMFDLRYWAAYVVAMVVAEAWLIGRRGLKMGWGESFFRSVVANFFTGMCGGLGCIAPFFHQSFVNTDSGPNPLANAVALLAIFAIPSALLESFVWAFRRDRSKHNSAAITSLWVHAALIPVGLGILLIPERPYPGLEASEMSRRRLGITGVADAVEGFLSEKQHLPSANSVEALIAELKAAGYELDSRDKAVFNLPLYSRFSTGESQRLLWEFNPAIVRTEV